MKHATVALSLLLLSLLIPGLSACTKESPLESVIPMGCGSDGARMEGSIGTTEWCAGTSVIANGSPDGAALITGISLTGGTLVLQVDSMAVGQQPITEAQNGVLYTGIGGSYTVPEDGHGTLTITSYDPTNGRLQGTAAVGLRLNGEGAATEVNCSFDVTVTGQ